MQPNGEGKQIPIDRPEDVTVMGTTTPTHSPYFWPGIVQRGPPLCKFIGSCQSHVSGLAACRLGGFCGKSLGPKRNTYVCAYLWNRLALPLAMQSLRQLIGINQLNYEMFDKIAATLPGRLDSCSENKYLWNGERVLESSETTWDTLC